MPIGLLTDFGSRDPYVATVKGVLLDRCSAVIVDLSHDIEPYDVFAAGRFLHSVIDYYPRSRAGDPMIFVSVVDPGVGSDRKILCALDDSRYFLAPDNGLLNVVISESAVIHAVERNDLFLESSSRTFEGRDRFAPLAAAIFNGVPIVELGPPLSRNDLVSLSYRRPHVEKGTIEGSIVAVDRFGNLVTDVAASLLAEPRDWHLRIGSRRIDSWRERYEGDSEPFLLIGSGGTVEISVVQASAAEVLHSERFDRVVMERRTDEPEAGR